MGHFGGAPSQFLTDKHPGRSDPGRSVGPLDLSELVVEGAASHLR